MDVRVFAEVLAAIALRDDLRVNGVAGAQSATLRERGLQRRRRAARHLLERLRDGSAVGGRYPESTGQSSHPAVASAPLRSLAAVLAFAWQLPEGQAAGRLAERVARFGSRARPAHAATVVHPQGERAAA